MRPIDADVLKQDLTRFYDGEVTAKELIDAQPTVDGWVNVKDELPEEDTDVLVWNNLGMEIAAYTTNPVKRWYSYTGQEVIVKYWMLLPAPPEEVNGDA